ncbi:nuclear transport factor 2 family protein [Kitasatospora sp. NPDC092948]|uniref:nuclear transport factor 2 family protein n=1 Tax=Kitasatospora sp. NPDC092948 TaxID=3364088 RepID=UPI00380A57BC
MTDSTVAAAIGEHIRAFNHRDLAALMDGFTEDAVWITGTTVVRGRTALTELFADAMAGLLPRLTVQNLLADADRAACQLVETMTVAGEERTCSVAGFYRLRDGRITAAKIYREGSADVV